MSDEGANEVLSRCETLLENRNWTIDTYSQQMESLAGNSFEVIAEKAKKEKRSQWKPSQMVPVCDQKGTIMWVKGEFQHLYRVEGTRVPGSRKLSRCETLLESGT